MPRPLRLESEGAVYHVIARGNERKAVFRDDVDREAYLERLAACRSRLGFFVYAYCLMDNHVHLALERGPVPLSRIMLSLNSFYGQRFNRRHDRVGHLFQGRYKSFLVEKDRYLLALIRYVHANPLKAGIVGRPQDYAWSSDRYFRAGHGPGWLDLDRVLALLGGNRSEAVARYRHLMDGVSAPGYEDAIPTANTIVGVEKFAQRMLLQAKPPIRSSPGSTIEEIVGVVSRAERLSVAELRGRGQSVRRAFARSLAALLAWREAGIPVSRVADYFGRDESTLVKGIRRLEDASVSDERLRSRIHAISKRLPSRSSGVHG